MTPSYVPYPSLAQGLLLCLFYLPFLFSHQTQTTPLPLLTVAYLYLATLAGVGQGSDQSRTLSMQ